MPGKIAHVTKAQRAAVCGLVIAGVAPAVACEIAAVSMLRITSVLSDGWFNPVRPRNHRWTKEALEEIRQEYLDRTIRAADVAKKYGIHPAYLSTLARRKGWKQRGKGNWAPRKRVLMTREQRLTFDKLRRHGIDLEQARAVALA